MCLVDVTGVLFALDTLALFLILDFDLVDKLIDWYYTYSFLLTFSIAWSVTSLQFSAYAILF